MQHYGLNASVGFGSGIYSYTSAVIDLIAELGVRTIRTRILTVESEGTQNLRQSVTTLANTYGIRWHATCLLLEDIDADYQATMGAIVKELTTQYAPAAPGHDLSRIVASLGGPNEVNASQLLGAIGTPWYTAARTLQTTLWEQARVQNAYWSGWTAAGGDRIVIAGPSTRTNTTRDELVELGDLTSVCDAGNAHIYQRGVSPSTDLDATLAELSICFGDYPCLVTEAGYNNSLQTNGSLTVPEWASNIYAPRAVCDFFKRGAAYFRYELLDDPDSIDFTSLATIDATADDNSHFGIVAMTANSAVVSDNPPATWRKKPEFSTMQRWIDLLSDRDPTTFQPYDFTPTPLTYSVTGGSAVQQLLVQKHDGHHYLILWRDVDVYAPDPQVRSDLRATITPQLIDVTLRDQANIRIFKPASGGSASTAAPVDRLRVSAGKTAQVDLDYDLVVLEIW